MAKKLPNGEKPAVKKDRRGGARPNSGGARPGSGRKPFVPTDEERSEVQRLAGIGLPLEQIAITIRYGIHVETLREHFADDIQAGKAKANQGIGGALWTKAMNGDTAAAIFWAKTQMRWSEISKHELTGADGAPLEFAKVERVIVKDGYSYDEEK